MPNFAEIGQLVAKIFKFFDFLKMAAVRHLGFVWCTFAPHTEYLGVCITVQNLVMIDAVVLIILTFRYLARLTGKCLFTPQNCFLTI